jgi:hypothetical protein
MARPRVRERRGKEVVLPSWNGRWVRTGSAIGTGRRGQGGAAAPQPGPYPGAPRAPGAAAAIPERLDEISTVVRLGLPRELRRSPACTNIVENIMGSVRRDCRNVKRWRDADMALRWTAAMLEAAESFRRLKAKRHLPALRAALTAHRAKATTNAPIAPQPLAA